MSRIHLATEHTCGEDVAQQDGMGEVLGLVLGVDEIAVKAPACLEELSRT